jgi:hypothetical protein
MRDSLPMWRLFANLTFSSALCNALMLVAVGSGVAGVVILSVRVSDSTSLVILGVIFRPVSLSAMTGEVPSPDNCVVSSGANTQTNPSICMRQRLFNGLFARRALYHRLPKHQIDRMPPQMIQVALLRYNHHGSRASGAVVNDNIKEEISRTHLRCQSDPNIVIDNDELRAFRALDN